MHTRLDPLVYTYFTVYTHTVFFLIPFFKIVIPSTGVCLGAFLLSYTTDTMKARGSVQHVRCWNPLVNPVAHQGIAHTKCSISLC